MGQNFKSPGTAEKIDTFFYPLPTQLSLGVLGVKIGGREGGREGLMGWRDRWEGCDGNYEVGAYGMEWTGNPGEAG